MNYYRDIRTQWEKTVDNCHPVTVRNKNGLDIYEYAKEHSDPEDPLYLDPNREGKTVRLGRGRSHGPHKPRASGRFERR